MIMLATPITAAEANSSGLVAEVMEPGAVLNKAIETASRLSAMSPMALSLAKEAICRGMSPYPIHCFFFFLAASDPSWTGSSLDCLQWRLANDALHNS